MTGVDRFLACVVAGLVTPEPWTADATVDAVVPGWRFTMRGASDIAKGYSDWFAHPGQLEELRRHLTPTGEVVEYTVTWVEDGTPHAGRHVHVLDLDPNGSIASDHVWCGGRWPASLLAQMGAG